MANKKHASLTVRCEALQKVEGLTKVEVEGFGVDGYPPVEFGHQHPV